LATNAMNRIMLKIRPNHILMYMVTRNAHSIPCGKPTDEVKYKQEGRQRDIHVPSTPSSTQCRSTRTDAC
jgi:hypothetical protein